MFVKGELRMESRKSMDWSRQYSGMKYESTLSNGGNMLTAEEKKNFVSSIISFPIETIDQLSVQKQLHEMLLRDTVGGKLYKYRAFDPKGHSLKKFGNGNPSLLICLIV